MSASPRRLQTILPRNWLKSVAPDGELCYINVVTRETRRAPPSPLPPNWREAWDEENRRAYFYHKGTRETTRERPSLGGVGADKNRPHRGVHARATATERGLSLRQRTMQTTAAGGSRSGSGDDTVGEIDGGDGVDGGDDHGDARPSGDAAHLPRASSYGSARIAGGTAEGALYSEEETTPRSVSVSCSALFDEVLRCEHLPERAVVLGLLDKYTSHQISPLETIPTLERKVSRYFSPCAKIIIFRVCQTPFFVDITGRFCLAGLWARRCSNRRHSSPRIARGGRGVRPGCQLDG